MWFVARLGSPGTCVLTNVRRLVALLVLLCAISVNGAPRGREFRIADCGLGIFGDPAPVPASQANRSRRKVHPSRVKKKPSKLHRSKQSEFPLYENEQGEDPDGRRNWFMFQRTYPFNTTPTEGRRRAWDSRPGKGKRLSQTEADHWTPVGPMPTQSYAPLFSNFGLNSGRINAIAISPIDPQLVLVGAATGGIWRSVDGGTNFTPVSDSQVDLAVGSIAFSRSSPNVVYAGMGDMHGCCDYLGSGVLKSTDAGLTWTRVSNASLPQPGATGRIEVDPVNPNKVYVALYRSLDSSAENSFPFGGVYVSSDGGVNWTRTLAGLPRDLAINPSNPAMIYAAMRGVGTSTSGPGGGLYRSLDGGFNWTEVYDSSFGDAFGTQALRDIRVAVTPADPQRVYVYSGGASSSGTQIRLTVSTDGGSTFGADNILSTVDRGQFGYNTYLYADPFNANTVYIGARDVFSSTDGGTTWSNLTGNFDSAFRYVPFFAKAHPDQHALAFPNTVANQFLIGNDGGLYRTTDGGGTFQAINDTLSLTMFVSLARHPTDPLITYGGTQDNGTQRRLAGGNLWGDFSSGDGGHLVINAQDPTMLFVTYIGGTIWRFTNNGGSERATVATDSTFRTAGGATERTAFYAPLTGNGVTSQLYFGTQRVWTSTDLGSSWAPTGPTPDLTRGTPDVLSTIGVSKSNPNVIYSGSEQGRVMVSTDEGVTWTDANLGLPNRFITSINVAYNDPATAYLTVSGFGSGHVYKTTNTGASWSDISGIVGQGGLPNIPTSALLIDPANPNILYAGTDVGVFRSTTGGTNWNTFNDGLPPVVITALSINAAGQIQVGTYGRGAYELTAAPATFSISGRVTDGFGNGISGATVDVSGPTSTSTVTDPAGNYSLSGIVAGTNYTISAIKAGQFVALARQIANLNVDTAGIDLRLDPFVTVNVHAQDSTGASLAGVGIRAPGQTISPLTNALGNANLTIGVPFVGALQITLTPTKLGYAFNPSSFSFSSQNGNQTIAFTAIPPNPVDDARTLVAQTYRDFLGREADPGGLDYWSFQIIACGTDAACIHNKRIDVSAAFFVETEFQRTGSFVYRLYKGGLGRRPLFSEFVADRAQVVEGPNLEQAKQALALAFVSRSEFAGKYEVSTTATTFVDSLIVTMLQNSGVDLSSQRAALIATYGTGTDLNLSRALVLRAAIDQTQFTTAEYNPSFVLMQYFGYLRRDPEQDGYLFWLDVLNNRVPGNFRSMVCAFLTSAEFQQRFGSSVTRSNRDCGQ